jgi:hypothetical protein
MRTQYQGKPERARPPRASWRPARTWRRSHPPRGHHSPTQDPEEPYFACCIPCHPELIFGFVMAVLALYVVAGLTIERRFLRPYLRELARGWTIG